MADDRPKIGGRGSDRFCAGRKKRKITVTEKGSLVSRACGQQLFFEDCLSGEGAFRSAGPGRLLRSASAGGFLLPGRARAAVFEEKICRKKYAALFAGTASFLKKFFKERENCSRRFASAHRKAAHRSFLRGTKIPDF